MQRYTAQGINDDFTNKVYLMNERNNMLWKLNFYLYLTYMPFTSVLLSKQKCQNFSKTCIKV